MKILHCITSTGVGGAQVMLLRYLRALGARAQDHTVLSLMPPGSIASEIMALGVPVETTSMAQGRLSFGALLRLRRQVQGAGADLVHGWMYHGNLAASVACLGSRRKTPVVWGVHHSLQDIRNESRSTRWVLRTSAFLSKGVACISYCSAIAAQQHEAAGFAKHRRAVVPNSIDTDEFRPDPDARDRLLAMIGIPASRIIIGNVGRDHPMKDQARMVEAVAQLVSAGHDVHAVLIGAGQESGSARQTAAMLGINDRVTTLGERRDIAALVAGFDIFLLPSAWGEAFPLAVCEAMAAGVPAVVTDVGDSGWIVGDHGVVVRPGDTQAQADGLARLMALGPTARRALGSDGRRRICENFSMQRYIDAHDALYQAAMERTAPV
jgi:glycosyltransferase involved in cell wall biosynthesis